MSNIIASLLLLTRNCRADAKPEAVSRRAEKSQPKAGLVRQTRLVYQDGSASDVAETVAQVMGGRFSRRWRTVTVWMEEGIHTRRGILRWSCQRVNRDYLVKVIPLDSCQDPLRIEG